MASSLLYRLLEFWGSSSSVNVWPFVHVLCAWLIHGTTAKYLVVAVHKELAATLQAHKIWRITEGTLIPLGEARTVERVLGTAGATETDIAKVRMANRFVLEYGN